MLDPHMRADDVREQLLGRFRGVSEEAPAGETRILLPVGSLQRAAAILGERGARFVAIFVAGRPERSLVAVFAFRGRLLVLRSPLPEQDATYASLSLTLPACSLAERELHDREGVTPLGHPRLSSVLRPDPDDLERRIAGDEAFLLPYGPIRSGVFEAIQYVIETGGEDVLTLDVRPFFKHRGLEDRFAGIGAAAGGQLAERVAGIASVAHATAFALAVERALGVEVPPRAQLWRAIHAELERIANHLDVAARLAEDAALSVGVARMSILKEDTMRLRAELCGSRFGRGVVTPGGLGSDPALEHEEVRGRLRAFERELTRDRRLLLRTTSFTDRLIGSGTLERRTIESLGGVGPVARASGVSADVRFERPYGAYRRLGFDVVTADGGDAMARLDVRFGEIEQSLHLIRQALDRLGSEHGLDRVPVPAADGAAFGWSEAPQGELVYWVEVAHGRIERVRISSPSLHNWLVFAASFRGDVLTDFSFIEHSFGLTAAGSDR